MFRFLARLLGLVLVAAAIVAGVADAARSIASSGLVLTPLGRTWSSISAGSLDLVQAWMQGLAWPGLWDPFMLSLLAQPAWLVLGILGALFLLLAGLGRSRRGDPYESA